LAVSNTAISPCTAGSFTHAHVCEYAAVSPPLSLSSLLLAPLLSTSPPPPPSSSSSSSSRLNAARPAVVASTTQPQNCKNPGRVTIPCGDAAAALLKYLLHTSASLRMRKPT
jgi:hypothetical protein